MTKRVVYPMAGAPTDMNQRFKINKHIHFALLYLSGPLLFQHRQSDCPFISCKGLRGSNTTFATKMQTLVSASDTNTSPRD